jgi:ubiquinone/menaquinone biosynthesis C-methylase UbiE
MKLTDAIELIRTDKIIRSQPLNWADLGCGSGLFTQALSTLLASTSVIHAVDTVNLHRLPEKFEDISIKKLQADFVKENLPLTHLDGILMANSFHYVKDKETFLKKIVSHLFPKGNFLIVEYERTNSNPWVPYPITFAQLKELFMNVGFSQVTKLNERPSVYDAAMIYSAWIER